MDDRRPVIGICTALARASWGAWNERQAALLAFSYIAAIQRAGGLAVMIPPDRHLEEAPDEMLDLLDGLILATLCPSATAQSWPWPAGRSTATCPCSASAGACS